MRPRAPFPTMLLLALLLFALPARAQNFSNPDFEQGPVIPPQSPILVVQPGGTALTNWTVVNSAVSIITDAYWIPIAGSRSVSFEGGPGAGAIEQTVPTVAGLNYRVTFWISGAPFSTPTIKHLRVTAGPAQQDYEFDITPAWEWDMFWTQHTLDFTANSANTTVRFASLDGANFGPAIDNAKVELTSLGVPPASVLSLSPVSPDPSHGRGRIAFSLARAGRVKLTIFDVQGRASARLMDGDLGAGPHSIEFNVAEWGGAPGLYMALLETAGQRLARRFTVLH